ncbi:Scr1 family TA system antitoxin-like transcriptional regulator [Streptomyces sp. NPDC058426]|uniref:Scr1 family TA system antitoxin-like transcriptional regulator n=1 Tax=Streptomyces sp. NPDC058426 TaxID=3346493 RepID=UPI0036629A97
MSCRGCSRPVSTWRRSRTPGRFDAAEVMKGQLQRLLDVTEESAHVSIRVLPFGAGLHAGIDGAFQLLHCEVGAPDCMKGPTHEQEGRPHERRVGEERTVQWQ